MRLLLKVIYLFLLLCFVSNFGCEKERIIESKTNSPPIITLVNIFPEKPNKESELRLIIQSHDPDRDTINYHYQWIRNDEEIAGENKSTVSNGNFDKGDFIRVKVTPSDGKVNGETFLSNPVRVLNSPPIIQEVQIEPKTASVRDNLRVQIKGSDADGDSIYYTYQWEKNGVILSEERKEILERGQFKKGDSITVVVTPDDREVVGKIKKSEPIVITNSPPIIVSSPTTSIEGTTYVYQVKANDPDDDPIIFSLKSGPQKMEIDKNSGLIRWEIRKEDKGSHLIEIEASDSAGARSFQRFTLVVRIRGFAPIGIVGILE